MTHPFDLSNMRIAISGAGGGIGSATARLTAEIGAEVMLSDLEAPAALADELRARGRPAEAAALDVTDRGAVEAWAKACSVVDAFIDCAAKPGTLDDTSMLKPDIHIWTGSKQPWITIPEDVEAHEKQPS